MPRPLPEEKKTQIRSLAKLPQRTIAKRVGCSIGAVSAVLAERITPPATAAKTARQKKPAKAPRPPKPKRPAPEPDAVELAEALVAGDTTDDAELEAGLARLAAAGEIAVAEKDVPRIVAVEKARAAIIAQRAKARPAPIRDPNEQPEIVKAAHAFRDRVGALLDRLLEEGSP